MAGLSKTPGEPRKRRGLGQPASPDEAAKIRKAAEAQKSSAGRTGRAGSRKPEGSPDLVTTDLGLGRKLSDPDAPPTWHFRIIRQSSQVSSGFSNATTYPDARSAARSILKEYLELAKVPVAHRRVYACSVVQIGDDENIGTAAGRDIR